MKKKADKRNITKNITKNINIFSNISIDGKSLIFIIVIIIFSTLIISISNPTVRAEIICSLISMASDF